jgi:arsenate reductase (glutaredoxin)
MTYEELPIRETPPSVLELEQMLTHCEGDVRKLFNTSGLDYRELNLKASLPSMSTGEAIALLVSRGNLVKRPFLITDSFGLVGFKEETWASALS